jgi:hypothetical protein
LDTKFLFRGRFGMHIALCMQQLFLTPNVVPHRFGAIPAFTMASMVQAAK